MVDARSADDSAQHDPDPHLARLIGVWTDLSDAQREAIASMAEATASKGRGAGGGAVE